MKQKRLKLVYLLVLAIFVNNSRKYHDVVTMLDGFGVDPTLVQAPGNSPSEQTPQFDDRARQESLYSGDTTFRMKQSGVIITRGPNSLAANESIIQGSKSADTNSSKGVVEYRRERASCDASFSLAPRQNNPAVIMLDAHQKIHLSGVPKGKRGS